MTTIVDQNLERKKGIIDKTLAFYCNVPLPSVIEINESGTCNRKCAFCPKSDPNYPDVNNFIEPRLLHKLGSELASVNYKGIILFSGFCEPLLDKAIFTKIALLSQLVPEAKIEMVTNGDVLNKTRLLRLFKSGLSTLLISVYDGPEEAEFFRQLCVDSGLKTDQYVIRNRFYSSKDDFGLKLSNRSGMLKNAEFKIPPTKSPLKEPCYYPHYTFFMDYNGDVLMCPHDWGKANIVGNLYKIDFWSLWSGNKFNAIRRQLQNGNRCIKPCNVCDVKGMLMGKAHVKAWGLSETKAKQADE